jgi:hypothetical protein
MATHAGQSEDVRLNSGATAGISRRENKNDRGGIWHGDASRLGFDLKWNFN